MNHLIDIREVDSVQPWMEEILDDPEVFEGVSGGVVDRAGFHLGMLPEGRRFLATFVYGKPSGFFTLLPKGEGEYEIHTTMGKDARGKAAIDAMKKTLSLLSSQGVRLVTSFCYPDKPHTVWFAKKCGFLVVPDLSTPQKTHVEICLSSQQ